MAHEMLPITGEAAGLIREVLPAARIIDRMVEGAEQAIRGLAVG